MVLLLCFSVLSVSSTLGLSDALPLLLLIVIVGNEMKGYIRG